MHLPSRELIRQVQISTRSAAGLSDYDPDDPTLPTLPPLSAAVAASDPSSPQLRCNNCKGTLLRGSKSIICVYCGLAPRDGVVPDPISFTSTVGYQWLLRSLHLDGSEMIDPTHKREQNQGYNSPKSLIPLSEFLNFKISWPALTEKQETTLSEKNSEHNGGFLKLTGMPPDVFLLKSHKNEELFTNNHIGTSDGEKNDVDFGHQNLFRNTKLSEPADTSLNAVSGWEADFQSADSGSQHEFLEASVDLSASVDVHLAAQIDSVFGPKDTNDRTLENNSQVSPAFGDWNSDDVWKNTLSSSASHIHGGVDQAVKITSDHKIDHSVDFFQDFHSLTNDNAKNTENEAVSDEHKIVDDDVFGEWNDFKGTTNSQVPFSEADLFSFDNIVPHPFSTSTSNSNILTEAKAVESESPASDWVFDGTGTGPCHESAEEAKENDGVKLLVSQMHDLSFMLESKLSIPSDTAEPQILQDI